MTILSYWLKEVATQGYGEPSNYGSFPANQVEEAVGRYLADDSVSSDNRQVKEKLADIVREVRRRF